MKFNCVVSGIGGQGVLTLAAIIEDAALLEKYEVKGSEFHGLALRFGPLECNIRFGKRIFSPLVARGDADLIIALEPLEALRVAHYASAKTTILLDKKTIVPISAYIERRSYPKIEDIIVELKKFSSKIIAVDASNKMQQQLGHTIFANTYLLGIAIAKGLLPLKKESILTAITANVPAAAMDQNRRAFESGLKF